MFRWNIPLKKFCRFTKVCVYFCVSVIFLNCYMLAAIKMFAFYSDFSNKPRINCFIILQPGHDPFRIAKNANMYYRLINCFNFS